ncbi:DUF922 domain-containing protein [Mucilaginibacter psychrotolerans]|uniref:DUF922 domain-containing protein n=1 Tax=Mucilaginibacter psychrotolerans TaxID=1524096 RepID=A0A4Y8SHC2_9SPHI|nr:DUF922 domain-containing protein [Mucilaginibacter psychrotolerans]TFF38473.1 DUF922 domain-containing protein [Mucilaginibacter psychrotolerans]
MMLRLLRAGTVSVLLLLATFTLYAQPFRQLTADDFQGYPRANNRGVVAYTNCTLDFRFQATHQDGEYILHFNVRLDMNNYKSWIDRSRITSQQSMAEILKHEQGHYNIAYLEQQEVLRVVNRTRFTANYKNEAMDIFNRIDAKYKQLNIDYDEDTGHSTNKQQQHAWDLYFVKRIENMPPLTAGAY